MDADEFWRRLAEARSRVLTGDVQGLAHDLDLLMAGAPSVRERALVAPVQLAAGAVAPDEPLWALGISRLIGLPGPVLREALSALPDIAMLGLPVTRSPFIDRELEDLLGDDDPAWGFIVDPGPGTADELKAGRWSPPSVHPVLLSEIHGRIAWSALEAYRDYRQPLYLDVLHLPMLDGGGTEIGWEVALYRALSLAIKDQVEQSLRSIRLLLRRVGAPPWRLRYVHEAQLMFAPFAGTMVSEWLADVDVRARERVTSDPLGRAALAFEKVVQPNASGCSAKLQPIMADVRSAPWLAFMFLTSVRSGPWAVELAEVLLNSLKKPGDAAALPWSVDRLKRLETALRNLPNPGLALSLLQRMLNDIDEPRLRATAVGLIASAPAAAMANLVDSQLVNRLTKEELGSLPKGRRMLLNRRGVHRAVVDGSNVMFGGRSSAAGATPELRFLDQILDQLRQSGFEEIHVFVDARTRHRSASADKQELERRHARGDLVEVRYADPKVIESFLESPAASAIVSNDSYRQDAPSYPALAEWMPEHRLEMYIDHHNMARIDRDLGVPLR